MADGYISGPMFSGDRLFLLIGDVVVVVDDELQFGVIFVNLGQFAYQVVSKNSVMVGFQVGILAVDNDGLFITCQFELVRHEVIAGEPLGRKFTIAANKQIFLQLLAFPV